MLYGSLERGIAYSEACHIIPHSKDYLDDFPNMLVLCPNHHTLFDLGIITIDPSDDEQKRVLHIDKNHPLHNSHLALAKHKLATESVQYHHDLVFMPVYNMIN